MRLAALLAALCLAGCAAQREAAAPRPAPTQRWTAVLVAGDGSLPVFDNATGEMARLMAAAGTPADDIHRLSASPAILEQPRVQLASAAHVLAAIAALHPAPGQACLVYLTSHGSQGAGVFLAPRREYLTPAALDGALRAGCSDAPSVAIVSACYSGAFAAAPMTAPNRVVLTAARADRPSFGCGAGQRYPHYDECLLQTLASAPTSWAAVSAATDSCVSALEARDHEPASDPQAAVGTLVATLPPVGR